MDEDPFSAFLREEFHKRQVMNRMQTTSFTPVKITWAGKEISIPVNNITITWH